MLNNTSISATTLPSENEATTTFRKPDKCWYSGSKKAINLALVFLKTSLSGSSNSGRKGSSILITTLNETESSSPIIATEVGVIVVVFAAVVATGVSVVVFSSEMGVVVLFASEFGVVVVVFATEVGVGVAFAREVGSVVFAAEVVVGPSVISKKYY